MDVLNVVDCSRAALRLALLLGGPPLAAAVLVGLVVGMIQTMTQMHEPVVALAPRLIAVVVIVMVALPWLVGRWVSYASEIFGGFPNMI